MDLWIQLRTLTYEVPGSNALAATVLSLSKTPYPHCLVPQRGLKAVSSLIVFSKSDLLSYSLGKMNSNLKYLVMSKVGFGTNVYLCGHFRVRY